MAGAARNGLLVFDVEEPQETATTNWATYRHFIERLHRSFPPTVCCYWEESFDVLLRSYSHQIKLKLDRCSFGLIGYQTEASHRWLEFGEEPAVTGWSKPRGHRSKRHIAGSSFLGSYTRHEELEKECMQTIESICLGQQLLTSAVNSLATSTCIGPEWARSLIILRLMICEGSRFPFLSNYLGSRFLENLPAPKCLRKLLSNPYGKIRRETHCIRPAGEDLDPDPCPCKNIPYKACDGVDADSDVTPDDTDLESDCEESLKDEFYITNVDDKTSGADSSMLLHSQIEASLPYVRELSEVFFIRVSSIEGKDSGIFYGTIKIEGCLKSRRIYSRVREESECVNSGDLILLTGPRKPFEAHYNFAFSFALMDESSEMPPGNLIDFYYDHDKYDQPICQEFYGEHCSVSVCYSGLKKAMYATLAVTIVDKERMGHSHIYGKLSASCGDFGYEIVLFQKKAEEHVEVCHGRPIALSRKVVSVPWNSQLVLHAHLFEYVDAPFDQEIANGMLEFPLHNRSGTFKKIMWRELGKIQVKAVWK